MAIAYLAAINIKGKTYRAIVILSSITLAIKYVNETGEELEEHWLAGEVLSMEERAPDMVLTYKSPSGEIKKLLASDPALKDAIRNTYRGYKFVGGIHYHFLGSPRAKILLAGGVLLGILAILYLFFIPWMGEKLASRLTPAAEIELGQQMYASLIPSYKVDTHKTMLANTFYRATGFQSSYPVTITVVKNKVANAFAIPGGNIVVHDAILAEMRTHEELAALIGHEVSHVQLRHSMRSLSRTLARKMFLMVIVGNDAGVMTYLVNQADDLKGLEYSRSLELEADRNGLQLMRENNINPQGMLHLMELLEKQTKGKEPAAFASTHPVFRERIRNIQKELRNNTKTGSARQELVDLFQSLNLD